MRVIHSNAAELKLKGRTRDTDFSVSVQYVTETVGGTSSQSTVKDTVLDTLTGTQVTVLPKLIASFGLSMLSTGAAFESLTPSVASVDASGAIRYIGSGQCKVRVTVPGVGVKEVSATVSRTGAGTSITKAGWAVGSLAKHIDDQVLASINGKSINAANQNRFSSNGVDSFVRSNTHALAAIDLTGFAATQSWPGWTGGNRATAISPRHVVGAKHWFPPLNQNITFVAADNTLVVRQITTVQQIGVTDIMIGYLNADLPASIKPLPILPASFFSYLPSISYKLPVWYDFNPGILHIAEMSSFFGTSWNTGKDCEMGKPVVAETMPWWEWRGGSGSPVFTVINGEAVLLYCLHYGFSPTYYGGPFLSNYITEVNAAMASLHGSAAHQLQTVDLSGFTAY